MEMREPFKRLSEKFHVYAPDLLGYGLSDRPDIDYTPEVYIRLIEDILREVIEQPAAVIASSLTAAHAIEAAQLNPEWITALVLICPTGVRSLLKQSTVGKALEEYFKLPILGLGGYNALASRPRHPLLPRSEDLFRGHAGYRRAGGELLQGSARAGSEVCARRVRVRQALLGRERCLVAP